MHCVAEDRGYQPTWFCQRLRTSLPSRTPTIHLVTHEALYTCGEADSNIYLLERGRMKTLMVSRDGKECLLDICTAGELVGESCLLGEERVETITAMSPTALRVIPRPEFFSIIFDSGLVEDCLRYLAARLAEQQQIITHFVTADSEQRLAATLLRLARKLGTRQGDHLRIDEKITHEELAEIVGTTRSRVGYFLKRFRDENLIEAVSQSSLLINEERLGAYVQTWS